MTRKKKVVEQPKDVQQDIGITGGQKYTGNVSIKLVRNGKILRNVTKTNAGGYELFAFLISCLDSKFELKSVPKYIGLGYQGASDEYPTILHSVDIPRTSSFPDKKILSDTTTVPQINYQFTIPAVYLNSSSDSVLINRLYLYNDNNKLSDRSYCAEIKLVDTQGQPRQTIEIPTTDLPNYTLFITWSLYISN